MQTPNMSFFLRKSEQVCIFVSTRTSKCMSRTSVGRLICLSFAFWSEYLIVWKNVGWKKYLSTFFSLNCIYISHSVCLHKNIMFLHFQWTFIAIVENLWRLVSCSCVYNCVYNCGLIKLDKSTLLIYLSHYPPFHLTFWGHKTQNERDDLLTLNIWGGGVRGYYRGK